MYPGSRYAILVGFFQELFMGMKMEKWSVASSRELYRIRDWGAGYFDINSAGNISIRPNKDSEPCDLQDLVQALTRRGVQAPILFRFEGIIEDRVNYLLRVFDAAIAESGYQGSYRLAFPIKVNQQCHVIDALRRSSTPDRLGLEVGSKPELVAMLSVHEAVNGLLLCNGYKDREYIELALLGRKLGLRVIIIVEQLHELGMILDLSESLGIEPEIGLRFRPSVKGQGRWEGSAGDGAKFGLSAQDVVLALEQLHARQRSNCLKLLHYHIGSQITSIAAVKRVLKEATRMYTQIAEECPELSFFDVGGGLAVDYDGSRTNFASSMNYSPEEYARDIVYAVGEACTAAGIPHPQILTESGRAIMAYHSVLVTEVTHVIRGLPELPKKDERPSDHALLIALEELYESLNVKSCQEGLHDALDLRQAINNHFLVGDLNLRERAYAERLSRNVLAKIAELSRSLPYVPEDFEILQNQFQDIFFSNFSVFQSVPDFWAIENLFPVMPVQRLAEEPTARAIVADITCDSDGKIDRFIDLKDVAKYVRLHYPQKDSPYYLAVFLVGAYQEILGDLHNLFGDTTAVHVRIQKDGSFELPTIVEGDTTREVLEYAQYDSRDLLERLRRSLEGAVAMGRLAAEDSASLLRRYREALEGYTYLVK